MPIKEIFNFFFQLFLVSPFLTTRSSDVDYLKNKTCAKLQNLQGMAMFIDGF